MPKKRHSELRFAVDDAQGVERVFETFDEAAGFAVAVSASIGRPRDLDVLVFSVAGARAWGDDQAVAIYKDDPDASVHERIRIRADALGRIS